MKKDCHQQDCSEQEGCNKQRGDYGWGSWNPAALQVLNNPKAALAFLSCAFFTQAMTVNGLALSVVTTLERRFHLTSTDMGAVLIANDVANFLSSLPISYLGANNKPRWLGCGMLVLAVGAFVFALPHFVAEPYRIQPTTSHELCRRHASNFSSPADFDSWTLTGCGNTTSGAGLGMKGYMYVLVLGKFLVGTGACALFSLGVTYINENSPPHQSSVYLGIYYSFSVMGPAVGYLLASVFLEIPTDSTFPTNIDPEHPQWIGAWWIGFILAGSSAVVTAIFILGLPRRLASKMEVDIKEARTTTEIPLKKLQRDYTKLEDKNGETGNVPSTTASPLQQNGGDLSPLHGVVDKSARIMRNPTFVFLSLALVTEKGIASGIATFIAKYIESQFRTSAGEAAMFMGVVSVPGATIGTLLGGYLVKRFELQVRGIMKMCTLLTLMTMASLLLFLINCEDVSMAGVNTGYHNRSNAAAPPSLMTECNAQCDCSRDQYQPVCGSDDVVYFSPCLAGCQNLTTINDSQVYDNCTCVVDGELATPGMCAVDCPLKPLFLGIMFFTSMGIFITSVPLVTATLRAVTEEDGPFATGVQDVMIRGLGFIPCLLLMGTVIDSACVLQDSSCTNGGSCLLYVNRDFGLYLLVVSMTYKVTSCLFYALVLLFDRGQEHAHYSNLK